MKKLPLDFYTRDDVVQVAKDLIGKKLVTCIDGITTSATIVESEAYNGRMDKACHAYPNVRTPRTEVMYGEGGRAYVYLCYGIHHLFNVVTNRNGLADAVLIRAIEPQEGLEKMNTRRGLNNNSIRPGSGPGNVGKCMGITTKMTGVTLLGNTIWIEDQGQSPKIKETRRVGVDYAEEAIDFKWRFSAKNSIHISKI